MVADVNGWVLDEQTQRAAHLMPPPQFVNSDGQPYPAEIQRLVPGNDHVLLSSNSNGEMVR